MPRGYGETLQDDSWENYTEGLLSKGKDDILSPEAKKRLNIPDHLQTIREWELWRYCNNLPSLFSSGWGCN